MNQRTNTARNVIDGIALEDPAVVGSGVSRRRNQESGDGRKRLGARGEDAAALHLEALGYEIIARNWRSRLGELDLVARDGETVVFVEVKLRYEPYDPLDAVDGRKQHRLSRLAFDFLSRHGMLAAPARFDVVGVEGRTLECVHVPDAFDSTICY
jgi:putative endonuclease